MEKKVDRYVEEIQKRLEIIEGIERAARRK